MRTRLKSTKRSNNDPIEQIWTTKVKLAWWAKALIWNPDVNEHPNVVAAGKWFEEAEYGNREHPKEDFEDAKKNLDSAFAGVVRLEERLNTTLVLCFALIAAFMTAASKGLVTIKDGYEVGFAATAAILLLWRRRGIPKECMVLLPEIYEAKLPEIEAKQSSDIYHEYRARCCFLNTKKLLVNQDVVDIILNVSYVLIGIAITLFALRIYGYLPFFPPSDLVVVVTGVFGFFGPDFAITYLSVSSLLHSLMLA